jgi:hypothetical protein
VYRPVRRVGRRSGRFGRMAVGGHAQLIIASYSRVPRRGLPRLDPRGGAWPRGRPGEFRMPNKTLLATRATMHILDTAIAW